jgi:hypothetical protein
MDTRRYKSLAVRDLLWTSPTKLMLSKVICDSLYNGTDKILLLSFPNIMAPFSDETLLVPAVGFQ